MPGDLEQMIREHKSGKRQVLSAGKKGTPFEAIHAVCADVLDLKKSMSPLPSAVALLGKGVESVRLNIEAIAKNEYELRQENAELQRLQADGYPAILSDILDAMSKQNPANWRTVNKEVIGIITEELPQ